MSKQNFGTTMVPAATQFGTDSYFSNTGTYRHRTLPEDIPTSVRNYSETQIISFINDRIWGAVQGRNFQEMVDLVPKYYRAYKGIFKNQNFPKWRSQLYVRFIFKAVEVLRSYMQDAFFANPPIVTVDGSMPEYTANAKNLQRLYDYELYHTKFEMRLLDIMNFTLKYGTGIAKTYWRYELGYQHDRDITRKKFGFNDKGVTRGRKYVRFDDPWFMALDPRKVYPDPAARYQDELRYVIEEYETDLDALIKDKDRCGYINLESLYNEMPGYSQFGRRYDYLNDIYPRNQWNSRLDQHRRRVFISEYWGRLDMPGNQDDPRIYRILLANNRHIISLRPTMYAHGELPYHFFNIIPQEETLYGIGAVEPLITDNYILNALVNMRVDAMQYFLNPRMLVNRGALADRHSIEWTRPGEMIPVNSTGDLGKSHQQLVLQDTGIQFFRDQLNFHLSHGEETMALNPNAAGVFSRSRRSATEASMAMEGANARFNSMVKYWKYSGMDSMMRQYGGLMQQYCYERHFPVMYPMGPEEKSRIMQVKGEDIAGEMFYRVKDNTQTNKDVRQQLINNLLATLAPYVQQMGLDPKPILRGILEISPLAGELNLDAILPREQMPDIMGQESKALENMGGVQGMPGQANPGTPPMTGVGRNPEMQALAESMSAAGGQGGLF